MPDQLVPPDGHASPAEPRPGPRTSWPSNIPRSIQPTFRSTRLAPRWGLAPMVTRPRGGSGVTMSIRRMTLGSGYRYLMSSVARGDSGGPTTSPLTGYYAQAGTPPGRFLGRGLAGLDAGRGVKS